MSELPLDRGELGVQRGAAMVLPYDPAWARDFLAEKDRMRKCVADDLPLEHVGSTAVPGLAAKPIIDILAGFRRKEEYERCRIALSELGYEYKGDPFTPGDHIFIRATDGFTHTHKVHLTAHGGDEWKRKPAFRDYLISHPDQARLYGEMKIKLARRFPGDRREYSRRKGNFIREILARAMNE